MRVGHTIQCALVYSLYFFLFTYYNSEYRYISII
nr:MAG TPA: hypothetical protein [Caudoviricetes sp.]